MKRPQAHVDRSSITTSERRLRILVLHQHYWPETAATAQILNDLCDDLAARGHAVTVICGYPSYHDHANQRETVPQREQRRGVQIFRVWSYRPQRRTIPRRLFHYGSYFASSLVAASRIERPDVCMVLSTPPLLLGLTGALLQATRGIPYVYSVQDLYPDIAVNLGVLRRDGFIARASELAARVTYRRAAALITLSNGMAGRLRSKGAAPRRVHVVQNWADTNALSPTGRDNPFAREHRLSGEFVVQYSGNIGLSQGLECVLEAADALRASPIRFVLIGDGNAKPALQAAVRRMGLENVQFIPPQPRERLSDVLSSCDLGLVTMKPGVGNDLVPSKLYGIMAVARPVLAVVEEGSEVARVVDDQVCGWRVQPESKDALVSMLLSLLQEPRDELTKRGQAGLKACREQYSRKAQTRAYERIFLEAAG